MSFCFSYSKILASCVVKCHLLLATLLAACSVLGNVAVHPSLKHCTVVSYKNVL